MKNAQKTVLRSRGLEDLLAHDKAYACKYQEAVLHVEKLRAGKLNYKYKNEYVSWRNRKKWAKDHDAPWYEPMNEFSGFLIVNGPIPHSGWTLDRIDPKGEYTPENMRWASKATQSQNRTTARVINVNGTVFTLNQLAQRSGATYDSIRMGLNRHGEQYLDKLTLPEPSVSKAQQAAFAWEFPEAYRDELERLYKMRRCQNWLRPRFFLEQLAFDLKVNTQLLKSSPSVEAAEEVGKEIAVLTELFDETSAFVNSVNRVLYIERYLQKMQNFVVAPKETPVDPDAPEFDPDVFFEMDDGGLPWAHPPSGNNPVVNLFG